MTRHGFVVRKGYLFYAVRTRDDGEPEIVLIQQNGRRTAFERAQAQSSSAIRVFSETELVREYGIRKVRTLIADFNVRSGAEQQRG